MVGRRCERCWGKAADVIGYDGADWEAEIWEGKEN